MLRGMNLEAHQEDFPVFQLELGGTWTDSRHDEDQWGQYAVAMYLTALGYLEMFCFFLFEIWKVCFVGPSFLFSKKNHGDFRGRRVRWNPKTIGVENRVA